MASFPFLLSKMIILQLKGSYIGWLPLGLVAVVPPPFSSPLLDGIERYTQLVTRWAYWLLMPEYQRLECEKAATCHLLVLCLDSAVCHVTNHLLLSPIRCTWLRSPEYLDQRGHQNESAVVAYRERAKLDTAWSTIASSFPSKLCELCILV